MQYHPLLTEIAADIPDQKYLSCLIHGCQTGRPCCRYMCKIRNINNERQYSPRRIQKAIERRNIAEQVENDIQLALHHRDHTKIAELWQKKDTIFKDVSMFGCRSLFETPSVVMHSKTHSTYQLLGFEYMYVFHFEISRKLENVCFADWGVKV